MRIEDSLIEVLSFSIFPILPVEAVCTASGVSLPDPFAVRVHEIGFAVRVREAGYAVRIAGIAQIPGFAPGSSAVP